MGTWTFVRHGQSYANAQGWLAGVFDSALTRKGIEQAREAHLALADLEVSRTFASDLSRALDTAAIILGPRRIPFVSTPQLRERHCGVLERQSIAELETLGVMDELLSWRTRPAGGESLRDVAVRAIGWLAREDDGRDTLVVAHGALIKAVIGVLDQVPEHEIGEFRPANCQAIRRNVAAGGWTAAYRTLISSG